MLRMVNIHNIRTEREREIVFSKDVHGYDIYI